MKVLLVSPEAPDGFWGLKHALKFISKQSIVPPLGLVTVAAMLPKDWELKLVDMAVTKLTQQDVEWADYVFISAMYIHKQSVDKIIATCKKLNRTIVAGGPLFTAVPEDYDHIDHLVLNEAELTLPPFLEDLAKGNAGHIYRSSQWADIHQTPLPLWELCDLRAYAMMNLQYSRGCPFDCDFCDVTTLYGRQSRIKTKEQVLAELTRLYELKWRGDVFFVDDNLIGNKHHLKAEILPGVIDWMKKHSHPFSFNTQASINLADDDELMQLMVQAGFNCVFVGIETPNEESLKECRKLQNTKRDLLESVKIIQSSGMEVQGGFILGFDHDNETIFDNVIEFIQKSGIVTAMVGLLNAPKKTKLYNRLKQENRLLNYISGSNTDYTMNFVPKMEYKVLLGGYARVMQTIYSDSNYYKRIRVFLKNYKPAKTNYSILKYSDVKAFIKSLWYIGIKGTNRRYFWQLVFLTLHRPRYLNMVVTYSIFGIHFRAIFTKRPC
ncbi:MAG: B12-binding domain-containing radical SAM protein [Planctomycetes bacterium GWF2_50_10]|nr:MAG: B12-binding domain-containing radical SAM protein [Planctomycetes bacterium GWF2_50_10]